MLPVNPQFTVQSDVLKRVVRLTKKRAALIENDPHLLTVEKVNLLALLLGHKQITDVAVDHRDKTAAKQLLEALSIPYVPNHYTDPDGVRHEWLQVAVNKPTLDYVLNRRNELTVLEAGVLYGYPASACLAYAGLLEQEWFDKTLGEYFLSGVFSKPYIELERAHFERVWQAVAAASPAVAAEAVATRAQDDFALVA
ncbi:hypothetical protein [Streptomyces brasiliscabiei]|uniref:hypothetical protein n=1 Tax=Streptomyces brasiliscabiei TaxID=2736302 RepID=UPI001C0F7C4B|nr:hypothetical protein [Streptomyces brasiliscabiei]